MSLHCYSKINFNHILETVKFKLMILFGLFRSKALPCLNWHFMRVQSKVNTVEFLCNGNLIKSFLNLFPEDTKDLPDLRVVFCAFFVRQPIKTMWVLFSLMSFSWAGRRVTAANLVWARFPVS